MSRIKTTESFVMTRAEHNEALKAVNKARADLHMPPLKELLSGSINGMREHECVLARALLENWDLEGFIPVVDGETWRVVDTETGMEVIKERLGRVLAYVVEKFDSQVQGAVDYDIEIIDVANIHEDPEYLVEAPPEIVAAETVSTVPQHPGQVAEAPVKVPAKK